MRRVIFFLHDTRVTFNDLQRQRAKEGEGERERSSSMLHTRIQRFEMPVTVDQ